MAGIKCAVLRLSEPYGPGIEDGPVAAVIAKVVADEPIDVPEVDVPKDYIHTNDIASALIKTIRLGLSDEVLRLGICSGETTSVETWAHTAIESSGFTKSVVRLPSERDNGPGMTCDVQRAWRKMAFQAGVGIPEGMASLLPSQEPDGGAMGHV
jgi:nucleoside-diphosphate-sugar epimerase